MFPFFSPDASVQGIVNNIVGLIRFIWNTAGGDPALLAEVLGLRAFAGQFYQDAATGLAQGWAIVVDNLIDLALKVLGLDPQAILGDH